MNDSLRSSKVVVNSPALAGQALSRSGQESEQVRRLNDEVRRLAKATVCGVAQTNGEDARKTELILFGSSR